jgi:hypothetical protein
MADTSKVATHTPFRGSRERVAGAVRAVSGVWTLHSITVLGETFKYSPVVCYLFVYSHFDRHVHVAVLQGNQFNSAEQGSQYMIATWRSFNQISSRQILWRLQRIHTPGKGEDVTNEARERAWESERD